jgi:O-antigen/teichoic acid export membrane protein
MNFSSEFKKIIRNTGFLFGEKVINMGLGLFVGIWVARYLGPEDYGLLQYAQSLVALVAAIGTLGTTQIVIRDLVAKPKEREGQILGTAFFLMLIAGFFTALFIIGIGFLLNNDSLTRLLIIICSVTLVLQAFQVFDYWFQSKVLSKYSVYARTSATVIVSILKVGFIILSLNLVYFALAVIISGVISTSIWIFNYKSLGKKLSSWSFDSQYAKILLNDAWPLILSGISVAVYMKIDQVMLKSMVDANAVGNYAVAVKVSELWYFIPVTIASSVFPSIINSKKDSIEKYHRRLQYLYDVMAGVALIIAIPMTFLSDLVIQTLFGSEYVLAGGVLAVHIWAGIFVFLGVARSKWIINENYQFYGMIFTVTGALSNVVLNLWLIPISGIMGAVWATVISQAISAWLCAGIFKNTRIAFIMHTRSIVNAILIYPAIRSIKNIFREANR